VRLRKKFGDMRSPCLASAMSNGTKRHQTAPNGTKRHQTALLIGPSCGQNFVPFVSSVNFHSAYSAVFRGLTSAVPFSLSCGSSFPAGFCLGALAIRSNPEQTRVVLQNQLRFGAEATTPIRSKPHQTRANRSNPELLWETAGRCNSRFGIWILPGRNTQ
jgi:hypothetical protein